MSFRTTLRRLGAASLLSSLALCGLYGCAEEHSLKISSDEAATTAQPFVGGAILSGSDYNKEELTFVGAAFARIAASSQAFEECVSLAATCTRGYDCPRIPNGSEFSWEPKAGDPKSPPNGHAGLGPEHVQALLAIVRSDNDMLIRRSEDCDACHTGQYNGYGHARPEGMDMCDGTWTWMIDQLEGAIPWENLAGPWANAAAITAHEAVHTHGYGEYGDGELDGYPEGANSASHVVSQCLGTVLSNAAQYCPDWNSHDYALSIPRHFPAVQGDCEVTADPVSNSLHASLSSTAADGLLNVTGSTLAGSFFEDVKSKAGNIQLSTVAMGQAGNDIYFVGTSRAFVGKLLIAKRDGSTANWTSWQQVSIPSSITSVNKIAVATIGSDLHVLLLNPFSNSSGIQLGIKSATDAWSPFENVYATAGAAPGYAFQVKASTLDGELHVCALGEGKVPYHAIRHADGSWGTWVNVIDVAGSVGGTVAQVDCVGAGGNLYFVARRGGTLYMSIRSNDTGAWSGWIDINSAAGESGTVADFALSRRGGRIGVTTALGSSSARTYKYAKFVQEPDTTYWDGEVWNLFNYLSTASYWEPFQPLDVGLPSASVQIMAR